MMGHRYETGTSSPTSQSLDYAALQTLYDELPNERQGWYELYRGAFAQNLALSAGSIVMDGRPECRRDAGR